MKKVQNVLKKFTETSAVLNKVGYFSHVVVIFCEKIVSIVLETVLVSLEYLESLK